MKKSGPSSTPARGSQASLPQLLHLRNGDDQSHCKSPEQMALCKVESLAFDDILVFIVHFDVATEKGREQQVRKQARCFLRTPRWQYVRTLSTMARDYIFPASQENHSSKQFLFHDV